MKRLIWLVLLMPIIILAQDVIVPDIVSDAVETTVEGFVTKTWIMSSIMMAVIQALKKIMTMLRFDISGIKSQVLAIAITVLYVLLNMNVWQDGQISPDDVVLMIQGVVSAVGGIYGYKLLWKRKNSEDKKSLPEEETPCGK